LALQNFYNGCTNFNQINPKAQIKPGSISLCLNPFTQDLRPQNRITMGAPGPANKL
jgi:hypothetical protein